MGAQTPFVSKRRPQIQPTINEADNNRHPVDDRRRYAVKPILMQPNVALRNGGILIFGKDHVIIKIMIRKHF
ncbi:hypothetical protein GCM10019815_07320 [Pediococcus damnosus]